MTMGKRGRGFVVARTEMEMAVGGEGASSGDGGKAGTTDKNGRIRRRTTRCPATNPQNTKSVPRTDFVPVQRFGFR